MQVGWMRLLDYMTKIAAAGAVMRGVIEKAWAFGWRELSIAKAERGTEMMVDGVQRAVVDRVQKAVVDRVQKAAVDRMQKATVPTDLKTSAIMMIVMHPLAQGHMIGEQSLALWRGHQECFSVNIRYL